MAKAGCKARRVFSEATIAAPLADVRKVARRAAGPMVIGRAVAINRAARQQPARVKSIETTAVAIDNSEGAPQGAPFFVADDAQRTIHAGFRWGGPVNTLLG